MSSIKDKISKAEKARDWGKVEKLKIKYAYIGKKEKQLLFATLSEDIALIYELLNREADINARNIDGESPLHLATGKQHVEIMRLLLDKGADRNARNIYGHTPLHYKTNIETTTLLLDRGADINARDIGGKTRLLGEIGQPLFCKGEVVKLLLDRGADVYLTDYAGESPLSKALKVNNTAVAKLLLDRGAKLDATAINIYGTLHAAALSGDIDRIRILLDAGADINAKNDRGETPLHLAAREGHTKMVALLLDGGADVWTQTNYGSTPLSMAHGNSRNKEAEELLRKRMDDDLAAKASATPTPDTPIPENQARYTLTQTCLGNPIHIVATTERHCVYCARLSDPDLRTGKGTGYCLGGGAVALDSTCDDWTPNEKVRFWLSKGYMENNPDGWPRNPWYQLFDDGPDGANSLHG